MKSRGERYMKNKLKVALAVCALSICIYGLGNILLRDIGEVEAVSLKVENNLKTSEDVFNRLQSGNDKYVKSNINDSNIGDAIRRELYKNDQKPYVVVLTCADSRVIPENIFYTGPGEIIVARVAGNVVDDFVLGTIEFAVDQKKVPLIVVMGHQDCGAVYGALKGNIKGKLGEIIKQVTPSVEKAKETEKGQAEIVNKAVELNVENSIKLINQDEVVKKYIDEGKVKVVGANYSLETGKVKWLNK